MARLVYLGTPHMAVPPLETLVDMGHEIALVVTRPDKRRGRGSELVPSPVKAAAMELGLTVTDDLAEAAEVGAELGVVVAYGRIIPEAMLDRLAMVNLHFSLLPRWRGAAPVERAVLAGDTVTGVDLMAVEAGLDTGAIFDEVTVPIDDEVTAEALREQLVTAGCELLRRNLADGRSTLATPRAQVGEPTYAEKIQAAEYELDWTRTAVELHRVVRLGRAWTTFRGRRLRVLEARIGDPRTSTWRSGALDGVTVAAGDDSPLTLVTVQPEGKRPMDASAWVRGFRPEPGEHLGA